MHLLAAQPGTIADGIGGGRSRPDPGRHRRAVGRRHRDRLPRGGAATRSPRADPAAPSLRLAPVSCGSATISRSTSTWSRSRPGAGWSSRGCSAARLLALRRRAAGRDLPRARHPARAAAGRRQARSRARRAVDAAARGMRSGSGAISPKAARAMPRISCAMPPIADRPKRDRLGASRRRCCAPGCIGRDSALPSLADIAGSGATARRSPPSSSTGRWSRPANTAPVDALVAALRRAGCDPLPIFVQSLKDREAVAIIDDVLAAAPPGVVLNATGFAVSAPGAARSATPFDGSTARSCRSSSAGGDEASWRERHARARCRATWR